MSRLSELLRQVALKDQRLAADLKRETDALAERRSFGLNFERHVPEAVELPGRPVRKNDKVRCLPPRGETPTAENERLWRVDSVYTEDGQRGANIVSMDDAAEERSVAVDDLVVVAEFRDPIYPGLVSTGKVERGGPDKPYHTVINSENYHALQALLFTHRGKVDAIYIDPPYNTGNEGWIYNDRYVSDDDLYKHSKWLAFMERRLQLAKDLLKPSGVIIVAIGDEEHHRLRMLLDQVFDSNNFLANVTWQGSGKNDAKYTAGGVDYMLMYAADSAALVESGRVWREPKPGIDTVLELAAAVWKTSGHDAERATKVFRAELRKIRSELEPAVYRYDQIDTHGRVFQPDNLTSPNPRPNLAYELIHPSTGKPVETPKNGWRYAADTMAGLIASDRILFGPDETTRPRFKRFLSEQEERVPYPTFVQARMPGSKHVEGILGDGRFPNPKDYRVLARWLGAVAPADAVILDYFAGSGSTAEAVMRLNEEDGGTRRCVLVTNNEVAAKDARGLRKDGLRQGDPDWEAKGVYEYVAKPRVMTVVSGIRSDGSAYSEGLEQNVEFFKLTYEAPLRVSTNREFTKIAPFLWLRAGSRGRRIDDISSGWDVADAYGVIADLDQSEQFLKAMDDAPSVTHAFIVTDEDRLFEAMVRRLPAHVEPVRLYEAYLRNFEIEAGRAAR